jgi:hypothetical protein
MASTYTGAVDADLLAGLRALVDASRLRIVARLASRPADAPTLAAELRQPVPTVARQLDLLVAAGLVERVVGGAGDLYRARLDRVGALGRSLADLEAGADGDGSPGGPGGPGGAWPHDGEPLAATLDRMRVTPDEARVLRSYLVDGRLATIPAQHGKRQVVLRFLLERVFTEDRDYPEKEVNQRLALFHADVAALRRYLVDDGYVKRSAGLYRRVAVSR